MTFKKNITLYTLLLALSPMLAQAQVGSENSGAEQSISGKSVDIKRTTLAPKLDGILDDEIWQQATVITDLHQVIPVDHGEPSRASEYYIAYNEDYFYLAARLYDDPEQISARQLIQGGSLGSDDTVSLLLDTFNNGRTAFYFKTNPNGIRNEGVWESSNSSNSDWSGIWQVESRIDDQGWVTEIAIPFKTLNFDPTTQEWGFNVGRTISSNNETIYWSSFNRASNPSTAGRVTGISDIKQGLGLDIVPSLTFAGSKDHVTGTTDDRVDPSIDIFYKITPNLTGALTLNTDFSATEVDNRQVNLTRFSLFFPEKRDFFLQDSEIFSFGGGGGFRGGGNGIPFYSRRIGLDPFTGQPVDIEYGGKLAGRVGDISVGTLFVQQGDTANLEGQDVFVGRVSSNILTESKIGAIFTQGDPSSLVDNSLVGVDFTYQNTHFTDTHSLSGTAWYQQTDTPGMTGDDKAYSLNAGLDTQSNGIGSNLTYNYIGDDYNPAMGFVSRRGVESLEMFNNYNYFPDDSPWLRQLFGLLMMSHTRDSETKEMESELINFIPFSFNSHRGDRYNVAFDREREGLTIPFPIRPGIVIPAGKYSFKSVQLNLLGSNQRTLAPTLSFKKGDFYNGEKEETTVQVNWRPNRNLAFDFSYRYNDIDLPQGQFVSRLISLNANYAINSKWSWINLLQYDNGSGSMGLNSRLHWVPQAGEDLYLVVNYNFDSSMGAFREMNPVDSELVLKYTKNFRF